MQIWLDFAQLLPGLAGLEGELQGIRRLLSSFNPEFQEKLRHPWRSARAT